jgi:hypothetical protein
MNKEFIPYTEALALKKLGFDEPCFKYWNDFGKHSIDRFQLYNGIDNWCHDYIEAPTWQQAFRWFRKEHNLKFHIKEDVWNNWCSLKMIRHDDYISIGEYKTYEEAELECLKKLIEIVK